MKLVWTHMNYVLVENARNILEAAGIPSVVRNRFLSSGFGELSGIDSWPELWVLDEQDAIRAGEVLAGAGFGDGDAADQPGWTCSSCGESNDGTFGSCWHCGAPADQAPKGDSRTPG